MSWFVCFISVFFSTFYCASAGGLDFKVKREEVVIEKDQKVIVVDYSFTNTGEEPISILKIDAPCSCLSAVVLDEEMKMPQGKSGIFKPNSSGIVRATLDIGNFKGQLQKKVLLWTDSKPGSSPSTVLNLQVTVPSLITAFPTALSWKKGSALESKQCTILVTDEQPYNIIEHKSTDSAFSYELTTVRVGFEYILTVTPKKTSSPRFAAIQLTTDSSEPRYRKVQCYLSVKP